MPLINMSILIIPPMLMSEGSARQISCFVDAGAFNTWAEKSKFKTAAELGKDANALATSSPTKFGKGLNSRFHESTYTIQCRHKVGVSRGNQVTAVTLAQKFLSALSTAADQLNHTMRLISSKIEESLNPVTDFSDCNDLERFLTNVDLSAGYIDFTLCVISSLSISQLRNIGISGCKDQAKKFKQMLSDNSITMDIINEVKSPLIPYFALLGTNEYDSCAPMISELCDRGIIIGDVHIHENEIDVRWHKVPSPRAGSNIHTHSMVIAMRPENFEQLRTIFQEM